MLAILKAFIVGIIFYLLVVVVLPFLIPALMAIVYWVISFVVVVVAHFLLESVGFPLFHS